MNKLLDLKLDLDRLQSVHAALARVRWTIESNAPSRLYYSGFFAHLDKQIQIVEEEIKSIQDKLNTQLL